MNQLYPWTCVTCNSAGDILFSAHDAKQRLVELIQEHDRLSPGCKEPELLLADEGHVMRINVSERPTLFDVKAYAAYPD